MSDNIPLNSQRTCTEELYNLDVLSYVKPPVFGTEGSLNQLFMYITRALENSGRLELIQEQISQGMMKVYSNTFQWNKAQGDKLIAKLVMGDLKCKKKVDRKKIDEMKLGENIVMTLPSCNTPCIKGDNITLMNENKETLLEIRELKVTLSMPQRETRAAVEHEHDCGRQPTEPEDTAWDTVHVVA